MLRIRRNEELFPCSTTADFENQHMQTIQQWLYLHASALFWETQSLRNYKEINDLSI
jgi:hypothetical protein